MGNNNMDRHVFSNTLVSLYRHGVFFLFSLGVLFLTYLSFISTTLLADGSHGGCVFLPDRAVLNLLVCVLFLGALIILRDLPPVARFFARVETDDAFFLRIRKAILIVTAVAAVIWVISSRLGPIGDQVAIQSGVFKLSMGDFSEFAEGNYFYRYPQQYGLLLIAYAFSFVFGSPNSIAFQLFDVLALVVILRELSELCSCFRFRRSVQLAVVLQGLLFFPFLLYCSYIYGTIPGLAAALTAIRLECRFFQTEGKLRYGILSAACILLAVLLKSNYQIYLIGMVFAVLAELLRTRNARILILLFLLPAAGILASTVPKTIIEHMLHTEFNQPMNTWSWIAMGLSDGDRAPGAWNYLNVALYEQAGYRTDVHAELSKQVIAERLSYFWENKGDALRFFTQKLAYEWNNPDFQSFWNTIFMERGANLPSWVSYVLSWNGADRFCRFLNRLQSLQLTGVCLYVILFQREHTRDAMLRLLLPLIFLGGFLFHIFWEAAPRYTLPYYVLLFPFSFEGFRCMAEQCGHFLSCFRKDPAEAKRKCIGKLRLLAPYLCVLLAGTLLLSVVYNSRRRAVITSDSAVYSAFLSEEDKESS